MCDILVLAPGGDYAPAEHRGLPSARWIIQQLDSTLGLGGRFRPERNLDAWMGCHSDEAPPTAAVGNRPVHEMSQT